PRHGHLLDDLLLRAGGPGERERHGQCNSGPRQRVAARPVGNRTHAQRNVMPNGTKRCHWLVSPACFPFFAVAMWQQALRTVLLRSCTSYTKVFPTTCRVWSSQCDRLGHVPFAQSARMHWLRRPLLRVQRATPLSSRSRSPVLRSVRPVRSPDGPREVTAARVGPRSEVSITRTNGVHHVGLPFVSVT